MTTRIIDVRSADLLDEEHESLTPYENIQWMSVLKSLTGYQMYRRIVQVRVRRSDVLKFLLQERKFPRAFYHTLCEVESCLDSLPEPEHCVARIHKLQKTVLSANPDRLKQAELHKFIDKLQTGLMTIHNDINTRYFKRRH